MALSCESETRESYYMAPEKQSVILDDMSTTPKAFVKNQDICLLTSA